jgi:RHS repeat-associated protein
MGISCKEVQLGGTDGLYDYGARWYDAALGRWLSPDSIIPEAAQGVQAWSRYMYVNNAPTRYQDPTGHSVDCAIGETDCKVGEYKRSQTPPNPSLIKGTQIQIGIIVGFPVDTFNDPNIAPFPLLVYNLNFVFDRDGGVQIFQTTRNAYFVSDQYGGISYRPGDAELESPSRILSAALTLAVGVIGGSDFETTKNYEGLVRDYQFGVGPVGGDYYEYFDKNSNTFDGSKFWGFDIGYSVGVPFTFGKVTLTSTPLTPRFQNPFYP